MASGYDINQGAPVGGALGWLESTFAPTQRAEQYNAWQASVERNFNANQAQIQRDFEKQMSNTAYQRATADMRRAGLNPYAVYGGASSASTPSGAMASSGGGARSSAANATSSMVFSLIGNAFSLAGHALGKTNVTKNYYRYK